MKGSKLYKLGLKHYNHSCCFEKKSPNSCQEKIEKLRQQTKQINQEIKELEAKLNPSKKRDKSD